GVPSCNDGKVEVVVGVAVDVVVEVEVVGVVRGRLGVVVDVVVVGFAVTSDDESRPTSASTASTPRAPTASTTTSRVRRCVDSTAAVDDASCPTSIVSSPP